MTKLRSDSPVVRETAVAGHEQRPLVVELWPHFIVIRSKGLKSDTYTIDYQTIHETAAKMETPKRRKRQDRECREVPR
jgi:hypothetical protein